jgi:hypothetical protein
MASTIYLAIPGPPPLVSRPNDGLRNSSLTLKQIVYLLATKSEHKVAYIHNWRKYRIDSGPKNYYYDANE